jgi:hypothetical protein
VTLGPLANFVISYFLFNFRRCRWWSNWSSFCSDHIPNVEKVHKHNLVLLAKFFFSKSSN